MIIYDTSSPWILPSSSWGDASVEFNMDRMGRIPSQEDCAGGTCTKLWKYTCAIQPPSRAPERWGFAFQVSLIILVISLHAMRPHGHFVSTTSDLWRYQQSIPELTHVILPPFPSLQPCATSLWTHDVVCPQYCETLWPQPVETPQRTWVCIMKNLCWFLC